jgi:hypothetical protein
MKLTRLIILILVFLTFSACRKDKYNIPTPKIKYKYSFFVAGHTYGNPITYQYGLHPPFSKQTVFLNKYPDLEFGVFTGDVVPFPTQDYWDSARVDIDKFNVPIHIAVGNHDKGPIFDSLYSSHYQFKIHNDLFIILAPTNWNIENDQKLFLESTLLENHSQVNNIYIFTHELIWWSPTNEFANIDINYLPNYPGNSNYWTDIFPTLDTLSNDVVLFAGDLGATQVVSPYLYHKSNNITYIANGMGSNKDDNIIMVSIDEEDLPHFKLLGLNADLPFEIEKLDEFILP